MDKGNKGEEAMKTKLLTLFLIGMLFVGCQSNFHYDGVIVELNSRQIKEIPPNYVVAERYGQYYWFYRDTNFDVTKSECYTRGSVPYCFNTINSAIKDAKNDFKNYKKR